MEGQPAGRKQGHASHGPSDSGPPFYVAWNKGIQGHNQRADLIAQYRGQPERGYDALCDLLKRSLRDPAKKYSYALDIREIVVAGDFALVRLTWTLTVHSKGASAETIEEPGMDIFRRQADGSWTIFRYIAYEAPR